MPCPPRPACCIVAGVEDTEVMAVRRLTWLVAGSVLMTTGWMVAACSDEDSSKLEFVHWTDPNSGLTWQNPSVGEMMDWASATQYCADLDLSGYTDWRLPTIDDLRSLIRGCPATELRNTTCPDPLKNTCEECSYMDGPDDGCYWPYEMEGSCSYYWSTSLVEDQPNATWRVNFDDANVVIDHIDSDAHVRCIR